MLSNILTNRLQRELSDLEKDPPPGVSCYPKEDNITELEAFIKGPPDSPYEKGLFKLDVRIPQNYPFDPPQIRFVTLIYHPNIDDTGRICADILKKGQGWNPALNLSTTLLLLSQLLAQPNPDDPLDADIAKEYQLSYPTFKQKAMEYTKKYATEDAQDVNVPTNDNSTSSQLPEQASDQLEEEEEEQECSTNTKKTKLSLSRKKKNLEKTELKKSSQQVTNASVSIVHTKTNLKPNKAVTGSSSPFFANTHTEANTKLPKPKKKLDKSPSLKEHAKPMVQLEKPAQTPAVSQKEFIDTCTITIERAVPMKDKEPSIIKKAVPLRNESTHVEKNLTLQSDQPLIIDKRPEEQKKMSEKRSFSQLFDKDIIVLSDDEDDNHTSNAPVLHSLQLDRKQKRTKLLSLSKKKHKAS